MRHFLVSYRLGLIALWADTVCMFLAGVLLPHNMYGFTILALTMVPALFIGTFCDPRPAAGKDDAIAL